IGGVWCAARGPRHPIVVGITLLASGSVVAGLASGLALLVIGRGLQGLGGGLILVALYVLIGRAFDVESRPRAFSVLSAAWIVPSLVGPLVAGWLTQNASWRLVFLVIPVVMILPITLLIPRLRAHDGGGPVVRVRTRLQAAVAVAAALLLFQWGLLQVTTVGVAVAIAAGVVVLVGARYLLPSGALRMRRGLPSSVMMRGVLAGAFASAEVFVPLALVETRGLSVTAAGMVLATAAVVWSAGSYVQSRLPGDRDRSAVVRLGAVTITIAILSLPLSLVGALPPWIAALSWAVAAFGMGLSFPSISVQVMRLSAPEEMGANSSSIQVVDALVVTLAFSLAGFIHAAAVASGGATARTYAVIWAGSALLGATGVLLAGRMRPTAAVLTGWRSDESAPEGA
ncbi:MAG: MFS transporter, partial [Actinomycetes bacterium]